MSDFVQQNASELSFNSSDSWVILSPIELSIKRKIEAVGTPLKDWDIQINYGIKTGFNDAFIITTETRDAILSKCADEDERKRTEELIRPINEIASSHIARRTFIGNLYKKVKDPNLVGSLSGHKEGSKAFARYRDIDEDMKKELVSLLD